MSAGTRTLGVLVAMVLLPLALLAALGARLVGREERLIRQSFADLALAQLQDLRQGVQSSIEERERRVLATPELVGAGREPGPLRDFLRREPFFRAALVLDADGRVLYPPAEARSAQETAFLLRARTIVRDPAALLAATRSESEGPVGVVYSKGGSLPTATSRASQAPQVSGPAPAHGWYTWYDGSDLDLLLWQRVADDRLVAVEVDRARLLADVVARLPESDSPERAFALLDARGEVLHRWGRYEPAADATPLARLGLLRPLSAWQLVVHAPAQAVGRIRLGLWAGLGLGLGALALALSGLALLLQREHARGLRLAERRVSFVNRVSHELKTPLTNIRLYAELLEERLDEDDADARRQLAVVVAEGQRLGRLIDNVLTFGRQQRGALRLRAAAGCVDEVIARAIDRWTPALASKGVRVERRGSAPATVLVDGDALAQILDNLLSNVEKYAAQGGVVSVVAEQTPGHTTLLVADCGPGVPPAARERIFEPFERLNDSVTEAAAGTGIGLAVVRELARLHGGDAFVRAGGPGAVFEVRLATPVAEGQES